MSDPVTASDDVQPCAVLAISHEYGLDTSMHDSPAAAQQALYDYVRAWWGDEAGEGTPMPEDPAEAVCAYFETHAPGEHYSITTPTTDSTESR